MNWKLRIKNKTVLTGLIGALLLFIKQVTELFGLDLSTQLEQVSALAGTIITLLVGLGVLTDPTTMGIKDSGIVQTYTKPRDSKNVDEMVQWQNEATDKEFAYAGFNDVMAEEVEFEEGLRDVEDNDRLVKNYDDNIENSGVMLDTNEQVSGVIEDDQNTKSN
ncbi:phage holin [Staphylococcus simulans]|uniref:phage holin n=1 Tax=Staphylococcus simulans TaxID=1286 RepID=UPI0021D12C1A|nr:phage holin [Staphylococcus simulans]UXR51030.1 phage holin [Staphylococcus simulans]